MPKILDACCGSKMFWLYTNNIGGEIHLENENEGWIEITRKTLEEYFEEVRE